VHFADGSTKVVHFFASRLKYSRFIDIQIVDNEQQETVVRCLLRSFERFGGVPLMCVFDNMSSIVKSRELSEDGKPKVHWAERFGQLAIDCGFIPLACWPYRPQQKGAVENLVGFVKGNFFCGRTFRDHKDLEAQLQDWLAYVNQKRPCDATAEIPAHRLNENLYSDVSITRRAMHLRSVWWCDLPHEFITKGWNIRSPPTRLDKQ
jgi:transposase